MATEEGATAVTRAAYFVLWSEGNAPSAGDSVKKKIAQQLRIWASLGVRAKLFLAARQDCRSSWADLVGEENLHIERYASSLDRFATYERIRRAVEQHDPAFLYMRQELWLPSLELLARRVPTFMELNGDDLVESQSGPKYYWLYKRFTRDRLNSQVTGFAAVSHELARTRAFSRHGHPAIVVANGIDLSQFPVLPPSRESGIRFGFMCAHHGARWHGVPKVLELARRHPEWRFELIGATKESLGMELPNVTAHGVLARSEYEPILARCDVAFGTLAAHAKDCHEASPLKVRECLAYGLPIVSGVKDTDFPSPVPFILELPNTERNVSENVARIEAFAHSWKGKRVERDAVQHLDVIEKERRRLSFIRETATARASRTRRPDRGREAPGPT